MDLIELDSCSLFLMEIKYKQSQLHIVSLFPDWLLTRKSLGANSNFGHDPIYFHLPFGRFTTDVTWLMNCDRPSHLSNWAPGCESACVHRGHLPRSQTLSQSDKQTIVANGDASSHSHFLWYMYRSVVGCQGQTGLRCWSKPTPRKCIFKTPQFVLLTSFNILLVVLLIVLYNGRFF